jgi:hypothetical protein
MVLVILVVVKKVVLRFVDDHVIRPFAVCPNSINLGANVNDPNPGPAKAKPIERHRGM